jgi:hypothetical protein
VPTQVRAWQRTRGGVFVPWEPEANGHWRSRALGVSFAPQSFLLRIYGPDGELLPISEELDDQNQILISENRLLTSENRHLAALAEERARQLAELEAELRRLRGE